MHTHTHSHPTASLKSWAAIEKRLDLSWPMATWETFLTSCLPLLQNRLWAVSCLFQTKSYRLSPVFYFTTTSPSFLNQQSLCITITVLSIIKRCGSGNSGILSFRGLPVSVIHLDGPRFPIFLLPIVFSKAIYVLPLYIIYISKS